MFLKLWLFLFPGLFLFNLIMESEVRISDSSKPTEANSNTIKVEIWSDLVCPFCLIGKKKIELAIRKLKAEKQVEIIWHSYQLDPDFPIGKPISSTDYLVQRKGISKGQLTGMYQQLKQTGSRYGIDFQFEKAISYNTLEAHQIWKWAKQFGKEDAWKEATMKSHFTKGQDLSSRKALLNLVSSIGLDAKSAEKILETKQYLAAVQDDFRMAEKLGINGVPYFYINKKEVISGAEDNAVFENALKKYLKN